MESIFFAFTQPDAQPTELFIRLIDEIRPDAPHDIEAARRNLYAFCHLLDSHPEARRALRERLIEFIGRYRHAELYTTTGILPNTGFITECLRRIGHKLLPEALDENLLRTVLRRVFHRPSDAVWVMGVGDEAWLKVMAALRFDEQESFPEMPKALAEILRSLRVISYWIAAAGMEPELLRLDRALENYESPFATQNEELIDYIDAYPGAWRNPEAQIGDDKHLRVLLDQCLSVLDRIRKRAARNGTSVQLTYHIQRLQQLILRCERLLDLLDSLRHDPDGVSAYPLIVQIFARLVRGECQRNDLRKHWRQNTEIIALRVTDNASAHGGHYITETRRDYFAMARSAAIGGFIIAFMACCKLVFSKIDMPPLTGALVNCLNYGLGFCLIHVLHGSVATKQSAMTANVIAASIGQSGGRLRDIDGLTGLIARTVRSQIVAVLGNVMIALPLAAFIAWAVFHFGGQPFIGADKAMQLLEEQSPIGGGALFFAAIAGICLFLAGLISGYFDNYAAYNRIRERILQLQWPVRLLGAQRLYRIAAYIDENLGALAGNFLFGFLLGGATLFGELFGLPIDIRHVAFASAFVGIAFVNLGLPFDPLLFAWALGCVALIGTVNLLVSFCLALNVALRSRQIANTPWMAIVRSTLLRALRHPREFFMPPKEEQQV